MRNHRPGRKRDPGWAMSPWLGHVTLSGLAPTRSGTENDFYLTARLRLSLSKEGS